MNWVHLKEKDYAVSRWSGGVTTQVAIAPEGAVYGDRNFLWRVSSASVELEESDFTALPDYHRWISTLTGEMTLQHADGEKIVLAPYAVHQFDGGVATHSWGRCTDFNLMLRKGKAQGLICGEHLSAGGRQSIVFSGVPAEQFSHTDWLIFCGQGKITATVGGERIRLAPMEALLLRDAAGGQVLLEAETDAAFMSAEMRS